MIFIYPDYPVDPVREVLPKAAKFIQKQSCNSLKRVNVDFPVWMIRLLDREVKRLGVPRQSLIKVLIAQHLERSHA